MRSWQLTLGAVAASLTLTWILKHFFNINAFFLFVPLIFPLFHRVWRSDERDEHRGLGRYDDFNGYDRWRGGDESSDDEKYDR